MTTAKKKLTLGDYMKTVIAREGRIMCVCCCCCCCCCWGWKGVIWHGEATFFFSGIVKKFYSSLAP